MKLVNFAHPLSAAQLSQVEALAGVRLQEVIEVSTTFDPDRPFVEQVDAMLGDERLAGVRWEEDRVIVNPPSFAPITAILLARLHGLSGHFPAVVRLARGEGVGAPFYVREVVDLQAARDEARRLRTGA